MEFVSSSDKSANNQDSEGQSMNGSSVRLDSGDVSVNDALTPETSSSVMEGELKKQYLP